MAALIKAPFGPCRTGCLPLGRDAFVQKVLKPPPNRLRKIRIEVKKRTPKISAMPWTSVHPCILIGHVLGHGFIVSILNLRWFGVQGKTYWKRYVTPLITSNHFTPSSWLGSKSWQKLRPTLWEGKGRAVGGVEGADCAGGQATRGRKR